MQPDAAVENIRYFAFPQLGTSLGLYHRTSAQYGNDGLQFSPSVEAANTVVLLGKYLMPIRLEYQEAVPEISINFTPTGLNYFFDADFETLAPNLFQTIDQPDWLDCCKQVYACTKDEDRLHVLEDFLLKNLRPKRLSVTEKAIELMQQEQNARVTDLATALNVSEKSITRNFNRYVGCTPTQFRRILRFRSAVGNRFQNGNSENLTQVCLNADFYDSPHFTREFRKLTGTNPRNFFNSVMKVGDGNYPYVFL